MIFLILLFASEKSLSFNIIKTKLLKYLSIKWWNIFTIFRSNISIKHWHL